MADTIQVVYWTLERACSVRDGSEMLTNPKEARSRLRTLQSYADARQTAGEIVDGIWVTAYSPGSDYAGNRVYIPDSGRNAEEMAQPFGGWECVRSACRNCEANVFNPAPGGVAGCQGVIMVPSLYDERLNLALWETVLNYGLEDRLQAYFQVTSPLWFGFWIKSPLRRPQCELLLELLPRALPQLWIEENANASEQSDLEYDQNDYYGKEYRGFFAALKAAIDWELQLHVSLTPPGHVDCSYYTEFPHCPRCKAGARGRRDPDSPKNQPYTCKVCELPYDPKSTFKHEEDEFDWDRSVSLEKLLGDDFDSFAVRYANARGQTERQMREALDVYRNWPMLREVESRRKRGRRLERRYPRALENILEAFFASTLSLEISPGVNLELVLVPAGEFVMGDEEQTTQRITLKSPFYIGKYPITQEQWTAVMGYNRSRNRGVANLPVDEVTWLESQDFCGNLSDLLGRYLRLPTEAEWEYACRAGTSTRYWWGDAIAPENANFAYNGRRRSAPKTELAGGPKWRSTTPVDFFSPNPWGVCDMLGNVLEWCQDNWHNSLAGMPDDGRAWIDPREGTRYVVRGGGRFAIAKECRSSSRRGERADYCVAGEEADAQADGFSSWPDQKRADYFGLRVVCSPSKLDLEVW